MRLRGAPALVALALAATASLAQTMSAAPAASVASAAATASPRRVGFAGSMGERALLVIDGQLRTLAPGAVERGVRFVGLRDGDALVEIDGHRTLLRIGSAPAHLTGAAPGPASSGQIVLSAGLGGHFTTSGSINGRPAQFLVDTGATAIAMSQADADRIGLAYRNAPRGLAQTANGTLPVNFVKLNTVRIGDVEVYDVEAAVIPAPMSHVLLGNSFLTRFQMKRENDTLTLEKRH